MCGIGRSPVCPADLVLTVLLYSLFFNSYQFCLAVFWVSLDRVAIWLKIHCIKLGNRLREKWADVSRALGKRMHDPRSDRIRDEPKVSCQLFEILF